MTYRERREARAEKRREARVKRLRGRADKHEKKSKKADRESANIALLYPRGFQSTPEALNPGRMGNASHRMWSNTVRSRRHSRRADELRERADNIERAAKQANRLAGGAKA